MRSDAGGKPAPDVTHVILHLIFSRAEIFLAERVCL